MIYKEAIEDAISMYELPSGWSDGLLKEAALAASKQKTGKHRKNITDMPFATIDGADAKDFDDAIYCKKNENGYLLYVAIADVSYYVSPNSPLDKEAKKRGTSIYFPDTVVPMLPEELSNDVCSLRPDEERCSVVCEMNLNHRGEKQGFKFFSGLIKSQARLTYAQVEGHLDKKEILQKSPVQESIDHLETLNALRLTLRKQRRALEINPTEPSLELNAEKEVTNIQIAKPLKANKLVEEAMLLANESAAEFMQERFGFGVFRIHDEPDPTKLETLKNYFKMPHKLAKESSPLQSINWCLQKAHELKDDTGQILVLQTLPRAEYSTNNLGHFGLQLDQYAHFTSPIRRYPDLLVHRMISKSLFDQKNSVSQGELQEDCESSSILERRAEKASRQVTQVLICSYLKNKIGSVVEGTITGVTDFGLFVNLEEYFISGLLHVSDLPEDRYQYFQEHAALKGKRKGKIFKLGHKISVKITAISPLQRKINLVIANGK